MDACRGSLTYARDAVGRGRVSAARVSPHLSVSARPADILPSDLLARRVRAGSGAAAAHHRRITTAELYSTAAELRTENESNAARHPSRTQAAARAGPGAAALLCGRGCPAVAQPVAGRARARAGSGRTQQGVRPRFRGTAADVGQSRARRRLLRYPVRGEFYAVILHADPLFLASRLGFIHCASQKINVGSLRIHRSRYRRVLKRPSLARGRLERPRTPVERAPQRPQGALS